MKTRIGIVGGGQLGRMLGIAAKQLGFFVTVLDPTPHSPAGQVVDDQIVAKVTDEQAIRALAEVSDFLTFEVELANATVLRELVAEGKIINPSPDTLSHIKDKFLQKLFLSDAKIPTTKSEAVETEEDIIQSGEKFGFPLLLKARLDAYDGRGNVRIEKQSEISGAMKKLKSRSLYVEQYVPFVKEIAIMAARSVEGATALFPVVETIHKHNICHIVIAPADVNPTIAKRARKLAMSVMSSMRGTGVFGIEMFVTAEGKVLVNEIAPRVHNSGHYTIEACVTNQFEQHIRAITGLPLGSSDMKVPAAVMINILGEREGEQTIEGVEKALRIPNVSVHIYQKTETRLERKMGHITVIDTTREKAYKKAKQARAYISI